MDLGPEKTFYKDVQMANRHVKRKCSLIVRKVYIRTAVRYHLIPVRMSIIQNTRSKCW